MAPVSGPGVPTPLVDRGEASAVDNSQKAAMAQPKKRKKKTPSHAHRWIGTRSHSVYFWRIFLFPLHFLRVLDFFLCFLFAGLFFFLTSMRKDAN